MIGFALVAALVTSSASSVNLPIDGALVHPSVVLDDAAWAKLPHVTAVAVDHEGKSAKYEGVRVADALHFAGAPIGDEVRGSAARAYVVVSATDGYAAVFAFGELTSAEARCTPFLAETRDGAPLGAREGPLQVIAPCDRTHARWVRGVERLTVIVAPSEHQDKAS